MRYEIVILKAKPLQAEEIWSMRINLPVNLQFFKKKQIGRRIVKPENVNTM